MNPRLRTLLLALLLAGAPPAPVRAASLDGIVVVVDEEVVLASELSEAMRQVELQLRSQGRPLPPRDVLQRQVLERLILQRLQVQRAKNAGLQVSEDELRQALTGIAARNQMSVNEFAEAAAREGIDFGQFREQLRTDLLISKLRQREVESRVVVSEQDVDLFLQSQAGQQEGKEYRLSHILVAVKEGASDEERSAVRRQAEEVLARARAGEDFAQLAARYSNDQLALSGGDLGWRDAAALPSLFANVVPSLKPGEVSPLLSSPSGFHIVRLNETRPAGGAQMVDETHARHILLTPNAVRNDVATRAAAENLRRELDAGADFAALARKHSNDPGSANRGGDLGWQPKGSFTREFESQLETMQPGEIRGPFPTQFGWHIVQLIERRTRDDSEGRKRDRARAAIFQRKVGEEYDLWLRRLRDEAYVEYRLAPSAGG
ncbi:MAG TPA: peptidylprolyl isomerase [Nevskiales bacterium]|nr:peptidylprolyl isomerase [Nevskiales bacterium]